MGRTIVAVVLGLAALPVVAGADRPILETRLETTLDDLAAFGDKRGGSPAGYAAGDYLLQRFVAAGLANVRFETFMFPAYVIGSSDLRLDVGGLSAAMAWEVLDYSGVGAVDAALVYVGPGRPGNYLTIDAAGKVVLVDRDPVWRRARQYEEVIAHGGVAMISVSTAPLDLIQSGLVGDPEDGAGPIPAVTIGADDGALLADALLHGRAVRARLMVQGSVVAATGRNVVGEVAGTDPTGAYLLVGAHYDTWHAGSADNGTGIAAMLALAEGAGAAPGPRYGLTFVAFDAEESGLFGGYDYLRQHVAVAHEPMLGFVNLEIPAAGPTGLRGLARTIAGPFDEDLDSAGASASYAPIVDMKLIPQLFGGVIPTDIQGMYWYGLQGLSTACDTPWYHTVEDTPDKIDLPFLAESVALWQRLLPLLDAEDAAAFAVCEESLLRISVRRAAIVGGQRVEIGVSDHLGWPRANASVRLWVDVDDFSRVFSVEGVTSALGRVDFTVPQSALTAGQGSRWLHVTAGDDYPLGEVVIHLPDAVGP